MGPSPAAGLFKNCFGDGMFDFHTTNFPPTIYNTANFFIKKDVFTALGGFTEDRDVGQEDHEFLAKSVLQGSNLIIVPEPLLLYRMHKKEEQVLPYREISSIFTFT